MGADEIVVPELDNRDSEARLAEDRPVRARGLKRHGLLRSLGRIGATERRLRRRLGAKCFGDELHRIMRTADLGCSCGRLDRSRETLAQPKQHPSEAFLGDPLDQRRRLGLRDCLLEER